MNLTNNGTCNIKVANIHKIRPIDGIVIKKIKIMLKKNYILNLSCTGPSQERQSQERKSEKLKTTV